MSARVAVTGFAQSKDKGMGQGHTAPKTQPPTAAAATAPDGAMALGSVHIPKGVKADGKALAAGTYQVRLTPDTASPDAKGQTGSLERWVEFVKGGKVNGREVVTIVPQTEISQVQKDTPPHANGVEGRDAQGRRLRPGLDQQGRQPLPGALRRLGARIGRQADG